jgi:succinate dehydrogenase/fumarate reductase cytochrome b subunit
MSTEKASVWEWLARVGYGARGVVYISAGLFSLLAAVELRRSTEGAGGSLETLASWPFGKIWIAALGAGLWAFVTWRFAQAVLDADRLGSSPKAIVSRLGQALSGLVYAFMGLSAFELLDGLENDGRPTATDLLNAPFGPQLMLAAALVVLACAVANGVRAFIDDFGKGLGCSATFRRRAERLARAGYLARGAAMALVGLFLLRGALNENAAEIRDLGGALQTLEAQPFGSWMLAAVAAGLVAFGLFGLVEARHRRIVEPRSARRAALRFRRLSAPVRLRSAATPRP